MIDQIEGVQIRQKTIVQQVMEHMKEFVASGELKPGDRIPTEVELANSFGVSRSSIREAIKIFSYLGVFETQTRRGTILCSNSRISSEALTWTFLLGTKDFEDLIELRKAIEQETWILLHEARQANPGKTQATMDKLAVTLNAMKRALADKDVDKLVEADFKFHETVVEASGNEQYIGLFQTLKSFTLEDIHKSNKFRNMTKSIYVEHQQMVDALESGNIEKVLTLFRTHIRKTKKNVSASLLQSSTKSPSRQ